MSDQPYDCLIVGGGVAGCTAGIYAKRYSLNVVMLDTGDGGSTAKASLVENYPGFPGGIKGVDLVTKVKQQAEEVGVKVIAVTADKIEREGDLWRVSAGEQSFLSYTVIIAAGAYPRSMGVPGEKELGEGKGVSYCATCDGWSCRGKEVAVVGGGNSAVDEALYLSNLASKVYIIHRRDQLRAEHYMRDKAASTPNIEIVWDSVVTRCLGEEALTALELRNVKTDEVSELPVYAVFAAIGHIAKTEWLADTLKLEDDFIVTDQFMATSQPGIFACGDIRVTHLRQITTAVGDATIAAHSAYQYVLRNHR